MNKTQHIPVLLEKIVEYVSDETCQLLFDATLGAGGHTQALLVQCPNLSIIASDRDSLAIKTASNKLSQFVNNNRLNIVHDTYENAWNKLEAKPDSILMDLGVSSMQLDSSDRGFSFRFNTELDMRMDQDQSFTAKDLINTYSRKDLERIIKDYAEERYYKKIANAIIEARRRQPIVTTFELIEITKRYTRRSKSRHTSTQLFQAIRIEVNEELKMLERSIETMCDSIQTPGLIMIISFHSLEDRIVKHQFRRYKQNNPMCQILTKKPIIASRDEIKTNPRSRSAKLRIIKIQ